MNQNEFHSNPLEQFRLWFTEADATKDIVFPNAMSLATVGPGGRPSLRMVLLKGLNKDGFCFFTNFESRKGKELEANPFAALCFYWEKLGRQVRVEGKVNRISKDETEAYFRTRPRQSQIGAWASPQSQELASRNNLEERVRAIEERFSGEETLPPPPHWGGYCLAPDRIEFWINGLNRLHDRFEYRLTDDSDWVKRRLAP